MRRLLVLLGVLVLVGGCTPGNSSGRSSTSTLESPITSSTVQGTETTTTSSVPQTTTSLADWEVGEAEAALAAIDDFYATLNSGDFESVYGLGLGISGSRLAEKLPIAIDGLHARFEFECTLGSPGNVECVEYVTDDLYGPAGITNQATVSLAYHDDKLAIRSQDSWPFVCEFDPTGDSLTFLMEFRVWSAETHPELERYWFWGEPIDSVGAIPCTVYPFDSPESALNIGEIVPEFVAQSANWPRQDRLTSSGSGMPLTRGTDYSTRDEAFPKITFVVPSEDWRGATSTCFDLVQAVILSTPSGGSIRIIPTIADRPGVGFDSVEGSAVIEDITEGGQFTKVAAESTLVSGYDALVIEATVADDTYFSTLSWGRGYWAPEPVSGDEVASWVVETGTPDVLILATTQPPQGWPAQGPASIEQVTEETQELLQTLTLTPGEISECSLD